jgi:hypothetical protein
MDQWRRFAAKLRSRRGPNALEEIGHPFAAFQQPPLNLFSPPAFYWV